MESKSYINSKYGFSVDYPTNWVIWEHFSGPLVVTFAGPEVLNSLYVININLAVEQLPKEITIEEYIRKFDSEASKNIPDFYKERESSTIISGLPATVWAQTSSIDLWGKQATLKDKKVVFVKDNIIYVLTYDVPVTFYEQYANCFDLVVSSFKFN